MGSLIIVSGPVGAGKTTVARELVASGPQGLAYLEGDAFRPFIVSAPAAQNDMQRFTMIMRAMISAARHFARDEYEVVLDFSIPPWYLDAVRALMQGKRFDYVVLRPSESVCAARAAARAAGAVRDYARYHDLYTSFGEAARNTISDDESDAATVAAPIRSGLASAPSASRERGARIHSWPSDLAAHEVAVLNVSRSRIDNREVSRRSDSGAFCAHFPGPDQLVDRLFGVRSNLFRG